jgi:hypothetical protein
MRKHVRRCPERNEYWKTECRFFYTMIYVRIVVVVRSLKTIA